MAPARISEYVKKLIAPAGSSPGVPKHLNPFVESDANRVIGAEVVGQAKAWWIRGIFRLEAAEELVPNNESAAMVAVDVTGIRTVMHAMVRWSVQNFFERSHGANEFGVNPELVEQADRLHGHDHHRRESDDGQPNPEDETGEGAGPRLAQRGGEVVSLWEGVQYSRPQDEAALESGSAETMVGEPNP